MMQHIANYVSTIAKRCSAKWDFNGKDYFLERDGDRLKLPNKVNPDKLLNLEHECLVVLDTKDAFNVKWGI